LRFQNHNGAEQSGHGQCPHHGRDMERRCAHNSQRACNRGPQETTSNSAPWVKRQSKCKQLHTDEKLNRCENFKATSCIHRTQHWLCYASSSRAHNDVAGATCKSILERDEEETFCKAALVCNYLSLGRRPRYYVDFMNQKTF
jgi:hypothetical protein